ncbi:MAG: S8 family serine peptidase [bacterium]
MNKNLFFASLTIALATSAIAGNEHLAVNSMSDDIANVQNRCIVRLNDNMGPSSVRGQAQSMSDIAGASLKNVYSHSIKGFTINMPCHAAQAAFGKNSQIKSLTPDSIVSISKGKPGGGGGGGGGAAQQVSWGTDRVGGPVDGTGLTAWIIDSGIDLDHPDLNVDASRGFSAIRGKMNDENGHGTHVAGTIGAIDNNIGSLGVAPNTSVVPVRVLDRRGSGSTSGVIAGIDFVAANASPGDCANMSLGGGISQALDDAVVAAAQASGAFFTLAAGNEGDDANNHSPARANGANVFTISATDINDNMPSWSNYGNPPVDFAAPGVNIFSTWKGGGTNTISGTSMASPHACAVLMLTGGHPGASGSAGNDPDGNPDDIIHL